MFQFGNNIALYVKCSKMRLYISSRGHFEQLWGVIRSKSLTWEQARKLQATLHSCLKWPLEEIYNLIFEHLTYSAISVPNWNTLQKYFSYMESGQLHPIHPHPRMTEWCQNEKKWVIPGSFERNEARMRVFSSLSFQHHFFIWRSFWCRMTIECPKKVILLSFL